MSQDTMEAEEYTAFLRTTKWYAHADEYNTGELAYHAMGLAGEGGEFVDLVKKIVRTSGYQHSLTDLTPDTVHRLRDELGDILWYLCQAADLLGLTIAELAFLNAEKLRAREEAGGRQHVR